MHQERDIFSDYDALIGRLENQDTYFSGADNKTPKDRFYPDDLGIVRQAAILIPLIFTDGAWHMLFEVRALDLDVQPGDVCFPGGRLEDHESAQDAVIRETCEELLIRPEKIRLLSALPPVTGPGDMVVTPFTGVLEDYRGTFFKGETDRVFTVPLSWFLQNDPLVHRFTEKKPRPDDFPYDLIHGGRNYPFRGMKMTTYFYRHEEAVIWGFTAKVVRLFFLSLKSRPL